MRDAVSMDFVRFDDSIPAYEDLHHVWVEECVDWSDSGPITMEMYYAYLLMSAGPDVEAMDDEPIRPPSRSKLGKIPTRYFAHGHSRRQPKHLTLRDHRVAA